MMKNILLLVTLLCFGCMDAQNDTWYAFFDEEYIRGFKDANGKLMIEPKFVAATHATKFDQIMAAMELIDGHYTLYYLLKNGRQFAQDSIYFHDMAFDCESEGLMKFHGKDGGIGMFNGEGKIVIPAMYNELWPCRNGYIVALTGAVQKWDGEYGFWDGGTLDLIDRNNKTVINDFKEHNKYNLYSLRVTDAPVNNPIRKTFKGTDGRYYSFIDNEKEFRQFFDGFLKGLTPEKLNAHIFDVLVYYDRKNEQIWYNKHREAHPNAALIAQRLNINQSGSEYFIHTDSYITIPDEAAAVFEVYLDNCGSLNDMYPLWHVQITNIKRDKNNKPVTSGPDAAVMYNDGYERYNDTFTFLKTKDGFKLVNATLSEAN